MAEELRKKILMPKKAIFLNLKKKFFEKCQKSRTFQTNVMRVVNKNEFYGKTIV